MSYPAIKRILVCGATGQQGGAAIKALLARPPAFNHEILAVTRNPSSTSAQKLVSKPRLKVIAGDLNNPDAIFKSAGGQGSIWAAYLVTTVLGESKKKGVDDKELAQGKAFFDAAQKYGVKHIVFSSVDRGGDEMSWNNPSPVPHFITKHEIELYIRDKIDASRMTYTILRPVTFMENYMPGFIGRVFAACWAQLGDKKLQMVSVKDIGILSAQALTQPDSEDFKNQAIGLAGDKLTQAEANEAVWQTKGRPMVQTFWPVASLIKWLVSDLGHMFTWFAKEGCAADVEKCTRLNPQMMDFQTWMKEESKHK